MSLQTKKIRAKIIILTILLVFSTVGIVDVKASEEVTVIVDGQKVDFPDAPAYVDMNGRTQVPSRYIGEALGLKVDWNAETRSVTFLKENSVNPTILVFYIDSTEYSVCIGNSIPQIHTMDSEASISQDRIYIPVRYLVEPLSATVEWNAVTREVTIMSLSKAELIFELPGEIRGSDSPPYFMQDQKLMKFEAGKGPVVVNGEIPIKYDHIYNVNNYPVAVARMYTVVNGEHINDCRIDYFDKNGNIEHTLIISDCDTLRVCGDGSIVYTEKESTVKKVNKQGSLEWQIQQSRIINQYEDYIVICFVGENNTRLGYDHIAKVDMNGNIYARYDFEKTVLNEGDDNKVCRSLDVSVVIDNNIMIFDYILSDHNVNTHILLLLDDQFNIIKRFDFGDLQGIHQLKYDKCHNRLLLVGFGEISIFNMKTYKLERTINVLSGITDVVLHVDEYGNSFIRSGNSTLRVYDSEFTLLSKHHLKGFLLNYFGDSNRGNPCFLTCTDSDFSAPITRCYEVLRPDHS